MAHLALTIVQARNNNSGSGSSSPSSPEPPVDDDDGDFFISQKNDSVSSIAGSMGRGRSVSPIDGCPRPKNPIDLLPPELLISVFAKLSSPHDLLSCLLVSKTWARNCVDLLWHRPLCNSQENLKTVARSVHDPQAYFPYIDLVRRLNLSNLSDQINNGTLTAFEDCKRIERLTLTSCAQVTDQGIINLVTGNKNLLALDITGLAAITDETIQTLAEQCPRLQGLNITHCRKVTDESLVSLAEHCKYLKRLKLNKCNQITDEAIVAFAQQCPSMLEIDLQDCKEITDTAVIALLSNGRGLRELRLTQCNLITDNAFLHLPTHLTFESLRILDLTACHLLHDSSVEKIIDSAPRLRILVLAKCTEITDRSVMAITKLGKNLHDIHLGRCLLIKDEALIELVKACNRIRYIDLAGCHNVTNKSVRLLATLPKLRRIGLVKCQQITDDSILALANPRGRPQSESNLERVHLSYCTRITLQGIRALLENCPKLTHLSLTGIQTFFMHPILTQFCREAPSEFNDEQRTVFCVFSGEGVKELRKYLEQELREALRFGDGTDEEGEAGLNILGMMQSAQIGGDVDDEMDLEYEGGEA